MNKLLALYRKVLPESVRRRNGERIFEFKIAWKNHFAMERKHYGKLNGDKVFYIIRIIQKESEAPKGVFSVCQVVLNSIKYADERGWIPVVDYQNYFIKGFQAVERRGKENAWEYYFEPCDKRFSLNEVYKSKNVILGPVRGQPFGSVAWSDIDAVDEIENIYYYLIDKYIHIRSDVEDRLLEKQKMFPADKKILGVGIRAGFKWGELVGNDLYKHHPKGMDIDEYILETKKIMELLGYDYVFVSCDDRYYLERMIDTFAEKCLYVEKAMPHYFENGIPVTDIVQRSVELADVDMVDREKDYIVEVYLLSKCDSLFAAKGGGVKWAVLLNQKKYEKCILYENGRIE